MEDDNKQGADVRMHPDANTKCAVCGGRKSACDAIGHRPDKDRHILWHPEDLVRMPPADRCVAPDARYRGECAVRTLERMGYTHTGGPEWRPPYGKKPAWIEGAPLTDEQVDRMLRAPIPGGSAARDWFLPHEHEKGLANVRDVVRAMFRSTSLADQQALRDLVDHVWNHAFEDASVPGTDVADRIIEAWRVQQARKP